MYKYEKRLEYPVNIKKKDLRMAKLIMAQIGGSDGELGAALRYSCQRFTMRDDRGKALLSDIACEEFGHFEMLQVMFFQLIKNATIDELKLSGLDAYFVSHKKGLYPVDASGVPFTASYFQSSGDDIVDLQEDMAADVAT